MNKEEFIGKLQMVYVGDKNAFDEIVEDNQKLKNEVVYSKVEIDRLKGVLQTHEILLKTNVEEIDRLNNIIKELSKDVDMWNKKYNEQFNIITELEKWLEERTYGMNEIHTYKIGALEDEVILNKLKALKENNK